MIKLKLYNFLVQPKYRFCRHILLILTFTLLAFRRILLIYNDSEEVLGNKVYIICLITTFVYLLSIYTNLYYLIPRFLLNKRYRLYLVGLFLVVLTPLVYQLGQEYVVRTMLNLPHRFTSYFNLSIIVANLSSFVTIFICVVGTSIPLVFKIRVQENQRMNKMEQAHIKTELDRLKKQISPSFLSNILRKSSVLVKTDSQKASEMLMRLGQLLRYQLYDCSRNKVLLNAEIDFIKEYLDLERLHCNRFVYEFKVNNVKGLFVPPLLFIPFIQYSTNRVEDSDKPVVMYLDLQVDDDSLLFVAQSKNESKLSASELFAIKKRLSLIYPNNYTLTITNDKTSLQINNLSML